MEERLRELLSKRARSVISGTGLRCAAVLVPLLTIEGVCHILFIRRSRQVANHKGEISFPGGLCEKEDGGPEATALRETDEEIGIAPRQVTVLGMADDCETVSTRYLVSPVVGVISGPYVFTPCEREVAEVITIPVNHLLAGENGRTETVLRQGKRYTGCVYHYGDCIIWGATARIVENFLGLWRAAEITARGAVAAGQEPLRWTGDTGSSP